MFLKMSIRKQTPKWHIVSQKCYRQGWIACLSSLSSFPILFLLSLSLFFFLTNIQSSQSLMNYEDALWSCTHPGLPLPNNEFCLCLANTLTHSLIFFQIIRWIFSQGIQTISNSPFFQCLFFLLKLIPSTFLHLVCELPLSFPMILEPIRTSVRQVHTYNALICRVQLCKAVL